MVEYKLSPERRQQLKEFIANPCDKTLTNFIQSAMQTRFCLLWAVVKDQEQLPAACPDLCNDLSEERMKRFSRNYRGCRDFTAMKAWHDYPSMFLLSMIEFDAYLDTL